MKVSVYCTVYNHEKYVKDALEGFVNQVTDFEYEVFVHDDASTDGSAEIIREYAEKYPDIIKPIFQTENQYSKNVSIFETFFRPRMRGEYVAACEGDDFWTDPHKLQMQVDFLDSHPEYSACVHNCCMLDVRTNQKRVMYGSEDYDVGFLDVIQGGSACYQTASLMYRMQYAQNRPDFYYHASRNGFGDYPMSIHLALSGKIRFLGQVMSVYRFGSGSSWTAKNTRDMHKNALYYRHAAQMLEEINDYTDRKYDAEIEKVVVRHRYMELYFDEKYSQLRKPPYRDLYLTEPVSYRLKTYLKQFANPVYHAFRKIKYSRV